ncbi:Metal regulatory transcription factor 1 [Halotydeus destructor]|nr:Metal regulatory transcription factor 1 [Halotydeus destructor]
MKRTARKSCAGVAAAVAACLDDPRPARKVHRPTEDHHNGQGDNSSQGHLGKLYIDEEEENSMPLPVPGTDFEMDLRTDSDEGEEIISQYMDPSDVIPDENDDGDFVEDAEGVVDYGMYTRSTENSRCVFCHEMFDSKAALLIHKTCYFIRKGVEAVNQGEKPFCGSRYNFQCEVDDCNQICQDLPSLKLHMLTHWGGMFECKECTYKSAAETHMKQHLITHTGEKPYKCHRCEKAFTQSHSLKTHVESAHFNVQFKCKDGSCNMLFNTLGSMKNHYKQHHQLNKALKVQDNKQEPLVAIQENNQDNSSPNSTNAESPSGGGDWICSYPDCGRSFGTEKNRLIHTTKKHPGFRHPTN